MKKKLFLGLIVGTFGILSVTPALASTVRYKGYAVEWDHGCFAHVKSYSKVQTHRFTHSATANGVFSGWKRKGVLADAETWITPGTRATAYWDCK